MAFHQNAVAGDATSTSTTTLRGSLASLLSAIRAAVAAGARGYAAAGLFQELSALSDAELERRGLSRATLARDVLAHCDDRDAGR
jgi:hypothetical protein